MYQRGAMAAVGFTTSGLLATTGYLMVAWILAALCCLIAGSLILRSRVVRRGRGRD